MLDYWMYEITCATAYSSVNVWKHFLYLLFISWEKLLGGSQIRKGACKRPFAGDLELSYGTSISSILPSFRRCRTLILPLPSRKMNTSRSRNSHSFTASSTVMGRMAMESCERIRCASVVRATDGSLCTTTG